MSNKGLCDKNNTSTGFFKVNKTLGNVYLLIIIKLLTCWRFYMDISNQYQIFNLLKYVKIQ